MTPEESAAVSAIFTGLGVGLSLILGALGLFFAARANGIAKKARADSARALELSAASNAIAGEANTISTGANTLAREANDISRAARDRDTERNDVDWKGRWSRPGEYVVLNKGQDTAVDVHAVVTVNSEVVTADASSVANGERLVFNFPGALKTYWEEQAAIGRAESYKASGPRLSMPDFSLPAMFGKTHRISERITWKSELGVPKLHEKTWGLSSLS